MVLLSYSNNLEVRGPHNETKGFTKKELSNQWYEAIQKWKLCEQKNWEYTEHSSKANHLNEYHQQRKQ